MAITVEIRLLGSPRVFYNGELLPPFPTNKCTLLLAFLILHRPRRCQRLQLAGLFWPDLPESRARRNFNNELWRLRRALGPAAAAIVADMTAVAFAPPFSCWVDIDAFTGLDRQMPIEQVAEAVSFYTGDLLAGFYEEWLLLQREQLRHRYLDGLERLLNHHQARREQEAALDYARRILALDPLREKIHRTLISLYLAVGDRVAAVKQYQQCAAVLEHELGLPPMPETEALYRRLLQNTAVVSEATTSQRDAAAPSPVSLADTAVFAGRQAELEQLQMAWQAVAGGQARLVTLAGEAGVGKTRLARQWLAALANQALVLAGRAYQDDEAQPYRPLVAALRQALALPISGQLLALPSPQLSELARLIPEIHDRRTALPTNPELPPAQARERLFTALAAGLAALTSRQRPLLLFVDDLHWADRATLDSLTALARALADRPLYLLVAYRPEALLLNDAHPLAAWLEQKNGAGAHFVPLELLPLTRRETADLLQQLAQSASAPAPLATRLYGETGGNPLFILETLQALFERGRLLVNNDGTWSVPLGRPAEALDDMPLAAGVRDVIQARLDILSPRDRRALTVAAVIGQEFELDLWQTIAGVDTSELLDTLARLLRARFLHQAPGGARFVFSHDKIREVIYQGVAEERRRQLHSNIASAIEQAATRNSETQAEALVHHYSRSDMPASAYPYLVQAAGHAAALHAYETAVGYYERALALADEAGVAPAGRFDLMLQRYHCHRFRAGYRQIAAELAEMVILARTLNDNGRLGQALLAQGRNLIGWGRWPQARQLLQEALDRARQAHDLALEADVRFLLCDLLFHESQPIADHARRVLAIGRRRHDVSLQGQARALLAAAELPPEERATVLLEESEQALAANMFQPFFTDAVLVQLMAGRYGQAINLGQRLHAFTVAQGMATHTAALNRMLSRVYSDVGAYEEAQTLALASLAHCRRSGYRYGELRANVCLALALAGLGRLEEALVKLAQELDYCRQLGSWADLMVFQYLAAGLWLQKGDTAALERARRLAQAALHAAEKAGKAREQMVALSYLAEISLRQGRENDALASSHRAVTLLAETGHAESYEPLVLFTHFKTLHAAGDGRFPHYRQRARDLLACRACTLPSRGLRRSYLHRVALHQAICDSNQ